MHPPRHFYYIVHILLASFAIHIANSVKLKPLVLVPGIGGSQIEAYLDRNETKHYWCYKKSNRWFNIWLSLEELLPMTKECWVDNMKLVYNPKTKTMENTPGVSTRTPDFGNTTAIEWLDPNVHGPGVYFYPLVQSLVNVGYKRGINLRAAPYDFRYDPAYQVVYFKKLKQLIEETYDHSGGKVTMISHSMGAPYTLYFLKQQSVEWKDKYIDTWITISGAFAGSVNAVMAFISGYGFGIPSVLDKPRTLREFERTYSSIPYLLPDPDFWGEKDHIVRTVNRTYGVDDWDALFDDIQYPLAKTIVRTTTRAWDIDPPNIKMYCFFGVQRDTPLRLNYRKGYFPDYFPDIEYGSGDGTVPVRSLQACKHWMNSSETNITIKAFPNAEHHGILADERLIKEVLEALGVKP